MEGAAVSTGESEPVEVARPESPSEDTRLATTETLSTPAAETMPKIKPSAAMLGTRWVGGRAEETAGLKGNRRQRKKQQRAARALARSR